MSWIDDVIRFWFDELRPKDWWSADPSVDERVRDRFGPLHEALATDPPDATELDARGHLAAVIVLDQFPRNLHRRSARAFATDPLALATALDAIDRSLDESLTEPERQFLYMPLLHAEDATMQQRSVSMFARLQDPRALRSATAHRDTFERFGRFPYRNDALGRVSTPEERAFLDEKPGPE